MIRWNDQKPEPAWQHALVMSRVSNFRLNDVSARQAKPVSTTPAISLTNCTNGIISDSMAQPKTGTFLSVDGKDTQNLLLHTNYLGNAHQPVSIGKDVSKGAVVNKPFDK